MHWRRLPCRLVAAVWLGLAWLATAGHAYPACTLTRVAQLPVVMEGTRPTLSVKIDGQDASFLVDSGAFFSLISPAGAGQLGLKTRAAPFGFFVTGVGGTADVSIATAKSFGLAGNALSNIDFIVGGGELGSGAIGVIGQNVLGLGDVDYDLADGRVSLMQPRGCGGASLAYWAAGAPVSELAITPTHRGDTLTHAVVQVNGVRVQALFDTGASTSLISPGAAARTGVRTDGPGVQSAGFTTGIGRRQVPIWIAHFDDVKIGDEEVRHTRLYIGQVGAGDDEMVIGADFFLSHRVYVANSQSRMYFTYVGGPVFDLSHPPGQVQATGEPSSADRSAAATASRDDPADAEGFSRRGAIRSARNDYAGAVADLTRAVALAPAEPRFLYQRALAESHAADRAAALADLDRALQLNPADPQTRLARAALRLAAHDRQGAQADVDAASAAATRQADLRLTLGRLDLELDRFDAAVGEFDLWIGVHGDDSQIPMALNGRCWARALAGRALDEALKDCNAAVRRAPHIAQFLDSRGLVHLRRGEFDRAIADYDAALAIDPKIAWSLYGRGLAELKTGATAQGEADIAAASKLAPTLAARAETLGLTESAYASAAPAAPR